MMPTDEQVFVILREAFPSLDEGHFRIMKETRHPYWEQAVYEVLERERNQNV